MLCPDLLPLPRCPWRSVGARRCSPINEEATQLEPNWQVWRRRLCLHLQRRLATLSSNTNAQSRQGFSGPGAPRRGCRVPPSGRLPPHPPLQQPRPGPKRLQTPDSRGVRAEHRVTDAQAARGPLEPLAKMPRSQPGEDPSGVVSPASAGAAPDQQGTRRVSVQHRLHPREGPGSPSLLRPCLAAKPESFPPSINTEPGGGSAPGRVAGRRATDSASGTFGRGKSLPHRGSDDRRGFEWNTSGIPDGNVVANKKPAEWRSDCWLTCAGRGGCDSRSSEAPPRQSCCCR